MSSCSFTNYFVVGDEVTSLKISLFWKGKFETPHVVSYFVGSQFPGPG